MRFLSIQLINIKNFGGEGRVFNFSRDKQIYTISGVNGAGKTALFKAIQLFQKLFFYDQLDPETDHQEIVHTIKNATTQLLSSKSAEIDIAFLHNNTTYNIVLNIIQNEDEFRYQFEDKIINSKNTLRTIWSIDEPSSIFLVLDAGKSFSDFGVNLESVSLKSRKHKAREFVLDSIFKPDEALQTIYKRTVLDHMQYRLDPSRTYEYFRHANVAIKTIGRNIDVKNVSSTKVDGHLVILGKTSAEASPFDVKDFSAGERSLYLTLLYLFYSPSIGTLVIDEPENHLHESLLLGLYNFLKDVMESGGIPGWLRAHTEFKISEDQIAKNEMEQIFLITHSKPLIYKNIDHGDCLVMSADDCKVVYPVEVEKELRAVGISTVFSKVVFVEGVGDAYMLGEILARHNIRIIALTSCKDVVDHFKKIAGILHNVHGASFCFAVDRDNKDDKDFEEIRAFNPTFYDDSFIVLDRHEIENYLIDPQLIIDAINPALEALDHTLLSEKKIKEIFADEAYKLMAPSKAKFIASALKQKIKELITDPITDTKNLRASVENSISRVLDTDISEKIKIEAKLLEDKFDAEWGEHWELLVDGKAFINSLLSKLSQQSGGIRGDLIRKKIVSCVVAAPEKYIAGRLVNDILAKMQSQTPDAH